MEGYGGYMSHKAVTAAITFGLGYLKPIGTYYFAATFRALPLTTTTYMPAAGSVAAEALAAMVRPIASNTSAFAPSNCEVQAVDFHNRTCGFSCGDAILALCHFY